MNSSGSKYLHSSNVSKASSVEVFDFSRLLGVLLNRKWLVVSCVCFFSLIGYLYLSIASPVYNASALIQVEEKQGSLSSVGDLGGLIGNESNVVTEIEIIRSGLVLGDVVEALRLDVDVIPKQFPIFGGYISRLHAQSGRHLSINKPLFGMSQYTTGGEALRIDQFSLSEDLKNQFFILRVEEGDAFSLSDSSGEKILTGKVGELVRDTLGKITIKVSEMLANSGSEFKLIQRRMVDAVTSLRNRLVVQELGRKSGILRLSLEGKSKADIKQTLNAIAVSYREQNINRTAEEADNSLFFLREQLPKVKVDLDRHEKKLNSYRSKIDSLDIQLETQALLSKLVAVDEKLNGLGLKEAEVSQKYQKTHPFYVALIQQRENLEAEKFKLAQEVEVLPDAQQDLLRLMRNVEVGNAVYLQMLNKVQELQVLRASTVSNIRILDQAEVLSLPVSPKKSLVMLMAVMLGFGSAFFIIFFEQILNPGVREPNLLSDHYALPNFGVIPFSKDEKFLTYAIASKIETKHIAIKSFFDLFFRKKNNLRNGSSSFLVSGGETRLLAHEKPEDIVVESIRSIRTSLHFSMLEGDSNILMITGATPSVGKSFVSANLSVVMAKAGQKVLLIDADLRRGCVHEEFMCNRSPGVTEILTAEYSWQDAIKTCVHTGVNYLTTGKLPPNPSELLMSSGFKQFLVEVDQEYDLVILDTPPVLPVTDAVYLGGLVKTTLLVIRHGVTKKGDIDLTLNRLANADVVPSGYIYNGLIKEQVAYGHYGYYQYSYTNKKD